MSFRNQQAFDDPKSRMAASGVDLRISTAITDSRGNVLAHAQSGGMLAPVRHEIGAGSTLFRFGTTRAGIHGVSAGAWWLDRASFDQLFRFAQVWDLSVGMAMRMLCLVPPEWSDATLLVRARTVQPLLAWRGLANSVVTPAAGGGAPVRMPHYNEIAARRLHQLFIPGLAQQDGTALSVEQGFDLDVADSRRGFIYL